MLLIHGLQNVQSNGHRVFRTLTRQLSQICDIIHALGEINFLAEQFLLINRNFFCKLTSSDMFGHGFGNCLLVYKTLEHIADISVMRLSTSWCHFWQCPWDLGSVWAERAGQGEVGGCTQRVQTTWPCLGSFLEATWLALGGPFLSFLHKWN